MSKGVQNPNQSSSLSPHQITKLFQNSKMKTWFNKYSVHSFTLLAGSAVGWLLLTNLLNDCMGEFFLNIKHWTWKSKFLFSLQNSRCCAFKGTFSSKMTGFRDTTVVPLQPPPTPNSIQRLPPCRSPPSSAVSDSRAVLTPSWGTAKGFLDLIARQAAIRLFSWLHTPQTGRKRNEKEGGNRE